MDLSYACVCALLPVNCEAVFFLKGDLTVPKSPLIQGGSFCMSLHVALKSPTFIVVADKINIAIAKKS